VVNRNVQNPAALLAMAANAPFQSDREPGAVVAWLVTDTETGATKVNDYKTIEGAAWMRQDGLVLATDYEATQRQLESLTQANIAIQRTYDDAEQRCEVMRARAEAAEALVPEDMRIACAQAVEFAEYVEQAAKGVMAERARHYLSLPYAQELAARLNRDKTETGDSNGR
jgi:hypothetical protein